MSSRGETKVIGLLPVRNGAADLDVCLESFALVADAVVALDDGSTDDTRSILDRHPLVRVVLSNPRRDTAAGWDDAANRNRLLEAAADLEPDWILSLDADEHLDPEDALVLRRFVGEEALPGFAYGFRLYRLIGDLQHFDRSDLWVYRLFSFEPDQSFPTERLHFIPIPSSIPRTRWLKTTVRIKHVAGLTEERRQQRYEKYAEADPAHDFQPDYKNLLAAPGDVRPWERRPPGMPVLLKDAERGDLASLDLEAPALSVVVISHNDEETIEASVRSILEQECPEPFEVIVVSSGTDRTAEVVRSTFPLVEVVELPDRALPGRARNAGLKIARGEYVSFPGSHVRLQPGTLAARLRAHDEGHAMVTGSAFNGTRTGSGWASYFLDHAGSLPGRPSGPLGGAPAHCSYLRHVLLEAGGFPENMRTAEDTVVNLKLWRQGYRAYREQEIGFIHSSPCRNPWRLMLHHFRRGRGWAKSLLHDYAEVGGLLAARPLRGYMRRRLGGTRRSVERWGGDLLATYGRHHFLVVLGVISAWVGTWFELLRPRRGRARILFRRGE
ncbi:MAG: glycosyltransferase family 2 protein [Actinomycetota bacterium]